MMDAFDIVKARLDAKDVPTLEELKNAAELYCVQFGHEAYVELLIGALEILQAKQALTRGAGALVLAQMAARDAPLRDDDIVLKLDDVALTIADLRRAAGADEGKR